MMKTFRLILVRSLLAVLVFALAGCAQTLQRVGAPEEARLSSAPIKELSDNLKAKVDKGEIPGAVLLIARNGKIAWFEAIGFQDREAKTPMSPDSIFRIASMTKPITSLSLMMLTEEGKLRLDDPLARYVPEFKDVMVGVETKDAEGKPMLAMEKPRRDMTLRDLLRHTSGLTYFWAGKSMVKDRYVAAKLYDPSIDSAEFINRLSRLPLQSHPGTTWEYSHSTDVLGRVVEVVSGMGFDRFVEERITKPLGMRDTAFWVDPAKMSRLAQPQINPATGKRPVLGSAGAQRPNWFSGGSGLTSTANDYARFCQFLLNGGTLNGVRLVSRESIDAMRTDQLPTGTPVGVPAAWGDLRPNAENGQGFGLGFMVRTSAGTKNIPGSLGSYFWSGAFGTEFLIDPKEQLFAIQLAQLQFPSPMQRPLRSLLREQVYKAVLP